MKNIYFLFLLLLPGLGLYAQNVIRGQVADKESRETLIGANVYIEGTTNGTFSQQDGSFVLKVADGTYKVVIAFVGYIETKKDVTIKGGPKDLGIIELQPNVIGLNVLEVVASFARDRVTPISVSRIDPGTIAEKLGTKEFPEILKSSPSVYATKAGGGYGDGRVNVRGFDTKNLGVLINGIPVNDMEGGTVYWSNWTGMSDVTRSIQVQRGLGASKLAISSVGGTINILSKTTDAIKGGNIFYGIGNDGYNKQAFTVSTGLMENGWAMTLSGSRTRGDGYVKGTNFEAWSYFFNLSKKISETQQLSFTAFGSPQQHNQRYYKHLIQDYRDNPDGIRWCPDYGYKNGQLYSTESNGYHKPQMALNHNIELSERTNVATVVYASFGRGYGLRPYGLNSQYLSLQQDGTPYETTQQTPDGHMDFAAVMDSNVASVNGSKTILAKAFNSHNWYGILSTLNTQKGNVYITAGIDGRYYRGYHYYLISDLLGGKYYLDNNSAGVPLNVNRTPGTMLKVGDKANYNYIGEVGWTGIYAQGEYVKKNYSGFVSFSASNNSYRRTDYFKYADTADQVSDWKSFFCYSGKGGLNYNLDKASNIYLNAGYFTRAPFIQYVFKTNSNDLNKNAKKERVVSLELGYGYRSKLVNFNLTAYLTRWLDKSLTKTRGTDYANVTGLNANHKGIEFAASMSPVRKMDVRLMASLGDWRWDKNVVAEIYDINGTLLGRDSVYAKGIHVGDAAQTTASVSVDYELLPRFKLGFDYTYAGRYFAYFDVSNRSTYKDEGQDAWELPAYSLLNMNFSYQFKIGTNNASLYTNVDNLFDVEYISDANDGAKHDAATSPVFFGFGRTWNAGLKVQF